jgi:hypothetical protein
LQTVSVNTFMNSDAVLMKKSITQADITVIWQYQKAVRSLMYIMLQTCSDITFAVSTVSQFAQNLNTSHYNAVKESLSILWHYESWCHLWHHWWQPHWLYQCWLRWLSQHQKVHWGLSLSSIWRSH